ncbi:MAG TPA: hypothetical protein VE993_00230, partial [Stellaceae bacterium]|nr:hypothetical protein [Stellaceae bacterium]
MRGVMPAPSPRPSPPAGGGEGETGTRAAALRPFKLRAEERARIAAIIPALDEAGAIGAVVGAVPREWVDDIIVVDGGSRDGTAE